MQILKVGDREKCHKAQIFRGVQIEWHRLVGGDPAGTECTESIFNTEHPTIFGEPIS